MWILSRFICLLLFVTLTSSGWGSVFASNLCIHAAHAAISTNQVDDACCPVEEHEKQDEHCNSQMEHAGETVTQQPREQSHFISSTSEYLASRVVPPCGHCFVVPASTYITPREKEQSRRAPSARPVASSQLRHSRELPFKLPVDFRQGSRPRAPTLSHILLGVFLI